MSRQNKVNPGQYTQRGRLTPDDAAREISKQRAIGSQHTWQPVQKDQMPRPRLGAKDNDADRDADPTGDSETGDARPSAVHAKPAARVAKAASPKKAAPAQRKVKQSMTASSKTAKKTAGKAKTAKTANPASKRAVAKTTRKAVLARNVGGGGPKPRQAAKRRKS